MVSFDHFPKEHWQHLRTTNPMKSPFAALRLRTNAAKRYKRVDPAITVIWKDIDGRRRTFQASGGPRVDGRRLPRHSIWGWNSH